MKRWLLGLLGGMSFDEAEELLVKQNDACKRFAVNMELARRSGTAITVLLNGERAPDGPSNMEIYVVGAFCRLPRNRKVYIAPWASMWSFRP